MEKQDSPRNRPRFPPRAEMTALPSKMGTSLLTDTELEEKKTKILLVREGLSDWGDFLFVTVYLWGENVV